MNKRYPILIFLLLTLIELGAFDLSDPGSFLGLTVHDLFSAERKPLHVYAQRGVEEDEDNVVFFYGDGFSLFLFRDRVWQVRYDSRSEILPDDLIIGQTRDHILSSFLEKETIPLTSREDSVTFQLREQPWPVRMTLFFTEDKLDDIYVYRADF